MEEPLDSVPPEARDAAADPARRLRHYVLVRSIGTGGMGEVWKAWDTRLRRWVAIKFLKSIAPEALGRFAREARLAAGLQHPNITPVHEVEVDSSRPFIVMEFVAGRSLEGMKRESRRAAEIVRDAARATHHAHQHGIVHRDLKPANLLESDEGRIFLTDFGLAKEVDSASLTQSSTVVGTPMYMSPEQVAGRSAHADARTDVYSLGAVLYELVTGSPPFPRSNVQAIFRAVLSEDPVAPRKLNPTLSRDLETIGSKAMEKEPGKRYATAAELADDLDRFLRGDPIRARPLGSAAILLRRARRNLPAAISIALLFAGLLSAGSVFAARTIGRRLQRDRTRSLARESLERSDWEGALREADRGLRIAPDDPELSLARRRALSGLESDRAFATLDQVEHLRVECDRRRTEIETLRERLQGMPPSQKKALWAEEDRLEEDLLKLARTRAEAEEAANQALRLDETNGEARFLLAELWLERAEEAQTQGRSAEAKVYRQRAVHSGGAAYRERLEKPATLAFDTEARAYAFRYVERDGRLLPAPFRAQIGEVVPIESGSVDPLPPEAPEDRIRAVREGTAYPLTATDLNAVAFPARVPAGSYLLLFRREGYADVRLLLALKPGEEIRTRVSLPRISDVPEGFVPVGSLFVGRWEVACGEYLEFLNDRSFHSTEEARLRLPRFGPRDGFIGQVEGIRLDQFYLPPPFRPDVPVIGISYEDAKEYARWLGLRRSRWSFRLPTVEEWEAAAGTVDGRTYVWGDHFDPGFCGMRDSRAVLGPEPGGLFPADESSFGIRDLAGGVREWTDTPAGRDGKMRALCGGGLDGDAAFCRIRFRGNIADPAFVYRTVGFRLVATLRP